MSAAIKALAGRQYITTLPSETLRAIVASTSPTGAYWLELTMAKDELARRGAAS